MKTMNRIFQKGMGSMLHFMKMKQPIKIEGIHSIEQISSILNQEKKQKPFLVTGPNVSKTDFFLEIQKQLKDFVLFNEVESDPTIETIERMVELYNNSQCDCFVAIGGGSNMDAMKACGARIACPNKSLVQMKGTMKVHKKLPLMVAIPTTAGTGSECTIATVIRDGNHKYSLNDTVLCPDYAILDPLTTVSMPSSITAYTGMDALTHAIEAYLNEPYHQKKTKQYCVHSVQLIFKNILKAYRNPDDLDARANMLEASYEAGLAFTVACVGNVHAIAHTFGGLYHVPHGKANAIILPIVLEEYGQKVEKQLAELARAIGIKEGDDTLCAQLFIREIYYLNKTMNIPLRIEGLQKKDINQMAIWAGKEANPLYPVPVIFDQKNFKEIIQKVGNVY